MDQISDHAADEVLTASAERLFAGGGEVGAVLARIDWAHTPLGPVETWPQALRTSLRICLTSRHDIILWWGPDLVVFYNDAYAPTLGIHHPEAAGKPGREVWAEIWDVIGPMLEGVLRTGQPTWSYDQLLYLERHGYPEETYHTFSYSPIEDDGGSVGGVFTAVTETTVRVLAERRAVVARDFAAAIVDARTAEAVCTRAVQALAAERNDVPFALLYLLDHERHHARLAASTGLAVGSPFAPVKVDLSQPGPSAPPQQHADAAYHWPLGRVARTARRETVTDLPRWPGETMAHAAHALPPRALLLPVIEPGQPSPTAILVAGANPYRMLDDEYERFYDLLVSHLAAALASAHAYEEARRRAEALAALDRAKTAFFGNVSHEFRTPLTLMLGPLQDLLARGERPPDERRELDLIYRNGLRLLELVNTLLDFARIEAGRIQASYVPVDLAALTAELASSFRSLVEHAGLRLVVDCPPLDEPVYVDSDMWEKIVLNLLSNAFKFTLAGAIEVHLRRRDGSSDQVQLMVRDSGVGIPAAELPRLFERFHRIEGTRARTHEGSGIGLALVQELVYLHGGEIHVESTEGAGTTFTVSVPLGTAHLPADRIQAPSTLASTALGVAPYLQEAERWLPMQAPVSAADGETASLLAESSERLRAMRPERSARIVLADDNADMRDYLTRLLGERYTVEAVANGTQALSAIRRDLTNPPDLVLSDVMMPELDGFGLLRAVRADARTANLPVILLSARAGEEATIEGLQAGADDYLVKPFSAREVLSRVAARLEITRARAEAERRTREALDALLQMAETLVQPGAEAAGEAWAQGLPAPTASPAAQRIVELTQRVVNCEVAAIVLFDRASLRLAPVAVVGLTPDVERQWWYDVPRTTLNEYYRADIVARLRAGETVLVDLGAQPLLNGADYGVRRVLIVPMRIGEHLIGLFPIEHQRRETPYSDAEVALVEAIARLAALIIERERLLREQSAAQARELALVETTRRMDDFLGIASHELRTPLTSITANVQLAERQLRALRHELASVAPDSASASQGTDDGKADRALARAHLLLERTGRQVGRMTRLVSDLLDISRIQAGKLELRLEPWDLLEIIHEAVQEQSAAWPNRGITLDLPHRRSVPLSADPDRVGQVVTNYLTNALKYSPDGQPVAVRVRLVAGHARVEVRDHGPGLSPAQQAHLFERFSRVPGIAQQSGSGIGLGLGLFICRTIAERQGGAVGVESAPGEGTTFWFTLPLAPRNTSTRSHPTTVAGDVPPSGARG